MVIVGSAVEQNRRDKQEFSFGFYALGRHQLRTEKIKKKHEWLHPEKDKKNLRQKIKLHHLNYENMSKLHHK